MCARVSMPGLSDRSLGETKSDQRWCSEATVWFGRRAVGRNVSRKRQLTPSREKLRSERVANARNPADGWTSRRIGKRGLGWKVVLPNRIGEK